MKDKNPDKIKWITVYSRESCVFFLTKCMDHLVDPNYNVFAIISCLDGIPILRYLNQIEFSILKEDN